MRFTQLGIPVYPVFPEFPRVGDAGYQDGALFVYDGIDWDPIGGPYYLDRANHTGTQLASTILDFSVIWEELFEGSSISDLLDVEVTSPVDGQVLKFTGGVWTNQAESGGGPDVTAGAGLTKTVNTLDVGTASSSRIVVNADNIDLASGVVSPGTYTKLTVDTYGRVTTGVTAVPSDIGAQPVDAGLTSIAALTGAGGVYATATDTFIMRVMTGQAGRISVTNGDGAAGAPNIDLASGVVTPGTYGSVTVDTYGRVTAGSSASSSVLVESLINGEAGSIVIGRAVYAFTTSDTVKLATANAAAASQAIGLVQDTSITAAAYGGIAVGGSMAATTGQWDAVTGQTGGLTTGAMYYLSNTTAGALTTTAPATGYIVPIGKALSTTKMALRFDPTIQL